MPTRSSATAAASIVPQQALALSNSKLVLNAADRIATAGKTLGEVADRDMHGQRSLLLAGNPTEPELALRTSNGSLRRVVRQMRADAAGACVASVHALLNTMIS